MKHYPKIILSLIICIFINTTYSHASHCYSYTVKAYLELFTKGGNIYLQETIKDHNEVSYVSRRSVILEGGNDKDFEIISDESNSILFTSGESYYIVPKNIYEVENYGINKVFEKNQVSDIVSNRFFRVNNQWYYVQPEEYSDKIQKKTLPILTSNLKIVADYNRGELLLKDDKGIYIFYENKGLLKRIPHLTASKTTFKESNDYYGKHFLYDDDTFYLISVRFDYEDITSNFKHFGKINGFNLAELIVNSNTTLDTKDGNIWINIPPMTIDNGQTLHFYPLKATYLNNYKEILVFNDMIYKYASNAIFGKESWDISKVKNIDKLHSASMDFYSDDYSLYKNRLFTNAPPIPIPDSILSIDATQYYDGLRIPFSFILDRGYLKKFDYEKLELKYCEKLETPLKVFSLALVYNNKFIIENTEMSDITNTEKLEFIGSTVDVINPCDGFNLENNTHTSVVVKYNYFFKDDKQVYSYRSGDKNLAIMGGLQPQNFKIDDYDNLIVLTQKMGRNNIQNSL